VVKEATGIDGAMAEGTSRPHCCRLVQIGTYRVGLFACRQDASEIFKTAWILGFISAFNQYGLQSQGADVSEGKNTDELMGWIDIYCRQHQGDDLHTASEAFIDDFRQRNRR
jgi:hypothetical protein